MELFDEYKTDPSVEEEGVWIPFPKFGDLKIKLARAGGGNRKWLAEREKALRALRKRYRGEDIPDAEILDAILEPFCKIILIDWEGLTRKGKPIEATYKNKVALMKELPDFYIELLNEASNRDYFLAVEAEEDAGKSQDGLSGMQKTPITKVS